MAGPYSKATGTRPKSGSASADGGIRLMQGLVDCPQPPAVVDPRDVLAANLPPGASRDSIVRTARPAPANRGTDGLHDRYLAMPTDRPWSAHHDKGPEQRRELMQQPDGEEQVVAARNQQGAAVRDRVEKNQQARREQQQQQHKANTGEALLIEQRRELMNKLQELEDRKRQMGLLLQEYNQVSTLSHQISRVEREVEEKETKNQEISALKFKLKELQDMVSSLERPLYNNNAEEQNSLNSEVESRDNSMRRHPNFPLASDFDEFDLESRMERSLALLTAQYEKSNHQQDEESEERNLSVPPPMSLLNNSWREDNDDIGSLASQQTEMRERREQLEQLMKKEAFNNQNNEAGQQPNVNKTEFFRRSTSALGQAAAGGKETNSSRHHPRTVVDQVYDWTTEGGVEGPPSYRPEAFRPVWRSEPWRENFGQQGWQAGERSASQQLASVQQQVDKLKTELKRLSGPPPPHLLAAGQQVSEPWGVQQLTVSLNQVYQLLWEVRRDLESMGERVGRLERRDQVSSAVNTAQSSSPEAENWDSVWASNPTEAWVRHNTAQQQQLCQHDMHHHLSPYPARDLWNRLQNSPGFQNGLNHHQPNLMISETDSGVSSGALNNQVSPGVRANNYYDNFRSFSRQNRFSVPAAVGQGVNQVGQGLRAPRGGLNAQPPPAAAETNMVNNTQCTVRPRRKFKINREQNRDQPTRRRHAAGPDPDRMVTSSSSAAAGQRTVDSTVDNLTKSIYSHVNSLIEQHDSELLARLLEDISHLRLSAESSGPADTIRLSLRTADTPESSSITSEECPLQPLRCPRNKSSNKRTTAQGPGVLLGINNSALELDSSDTLGASSPAAAPWTAEPTSVAVPKNQQKNLISRERETRKMPGWRDRVLPRNMQPAVTAANQAQPSSGRGASNLLLDNDYTGHEFINIPITFSSAEQPAHRSTPDVSLDSHETGPRDSLQLNSRSDLTEAELAEADQLLHDPADSLPEDRADHGPPVRDCSSPERAGLLGLDRVPIRLPSQGDERSRAEDEAVASIVEEVLASSPELVGAGACLPPPGLN